MDTKNEIFIVKARNKHGRRYSYSKINYINNYTKVIITCSEHGDFEQKPNSHLNGGGCPECGGTAKGTTESFIKLSKLKHGDKYDYSKVDYKNNRSMLIIICPIHGEFEQKANSHANGIGCPYCGGTAKLSLESYIKRAKEVHGDRYSYYKTIYTHNKAKVIVTCPIHGDFEQIAKNHTDGFGCPECGNLSKGFNRSRFIERCIKNNNGLGNLYVIRCFNDTESFYKIGITSRTIEERFKGVMPYNKEIVYHLSLESDSAYDIEHKALRDLYKYKYTPSISFVGETECFTDIEPIRTHLIKDLESRL